MAQQPSSLASPGALLQQIMSASTAAGDVPALGEMLESVQRAQGGGGAGGAAAMDQLEVFPEPGFVVKTVNEQGRKVFINVCGSSKLPLPGGWRKGEVPEEVRRHLEAAQGGDAPTAMRFPLSMAPPRFDADHTGQPCLVVDVMLNSEVLAQCSQYRPLKIFVIQLALGWVGDKVGLELSPQYKLPKMRYKGEVPPPPHRIRLEGAPAGAAQGGAGGGSRQPAAGPGGAKPLIAEVGPDGEEPPAFALLASKRQQRQRVAAAASGGKGAAGAAGASAAPQPAVPRGGSGSSIAAAEARTAPQQQQQQASASGPGTELQVQIDYEGKPASAVRITVQLPAAAAAAAARDPASISASVCAETVRVQAHGCAPLEVSLPFAVSSADASVELAGGAGGTSLVLRLPYRPFSSVLEELQRAQAAGAAEGPQAAAAMDEDRFGGLD